MKSFLVRIPLEQNCLIGKNNTILEVFDNLAEIYISDYKVTANSWQLYFTPDSLEAKPFDEDDMLLVIIKDFKQFELIEYYE